METALLKNAELEKPAYDLAKMNEYALLIIWLIGAIFDRERYRLCGATALA